MFETPVEKFTLVALITVSLAFAYYAGLFNAWLHPDPKPKISASNYPDFVVFKDLNSEGLELSYNPALAIVSPDRTPFIDLILKIKNDRDTPRTLKLVFPDPATLLTDDPKFVVAQSIEKDENTGQTYHRVVLFLPAKSEKEVKVRYNNAYGALDQLSTDIVFKLYDEDDKEIAEIPFELKSVVLSFEDIWPYKTMPTDEKAIVVQGGEANASLNNKIGYFQTNSGCSKSSGSVVYNVPSTYQKYSLFHFKVYYHRVHTSEVYSCSAAVYVTYDGKTWKKVASITGDADKTIDVYLKGVPKSIKATAYCRLAESCTSNGDDLQVYLKFIGGSAIGGRILYYNGHMLPFEQDGGLYVYTLPPDAQLIPDAINNVPITVSYDSHEFNLDLPVFYDPNKSHDLLWRMYEQWKSSMETNSTGGQ